MGVDKCNGPLRGLRGCGMCPVRGGELPAA